MLSAAEQSVPRPGFASGTSKHNTLKSLLERGLTVVCHGRAVPLLWRTLDHPSVSISAVISIALLAKADHFLSDFGGVAVLVDRSFTALICSAGSRGRHIASSSCSCKATRRTLAPPL